jgi:hypothetical protein
MDKKRQPTAYNNTGARYVPLARGLPCERIFTCDAECVRDFDVFYDPISDGLYLSF